MRQAQPHPGIHQPRTQDREALRRDRHGRRARAVELPAGGHQRQDPAYPTPGLRLPQPQLPHRPNLPLSRRYHPEPTHRKVRSRTLGRDDLHRRRTVRHYNVPRVNPGLGALLALHICPGRARRVRPRCIAVARAKVCAWMWRLFGGPPAARAAGPGHRRRNGALDVDSTLVIAHSDNDGAALTTSVRMTSIRSRSPATTPVNCSLSGCGRVTSGRTPPPITSTSLAEAIAQIHDRPSWSASMSAITSPPSAIMMARSTSRPRSLHRPPATPRQPGRQGLRQPGPAGPAPRPDTRTDRGPAQRTSRGDRGHPQLHTIAFGVSAGLLGLGFILVIVLLPSRRRLADLREAGAATPAAPGPSPAPAPPAVAAVSTQQPASEAIPVALCSCSPVITPVAGAHPVSASMGRITRMH
jgi:hypothetical protein